LKNNRLKKLLPELALLLKKNNVPFGKLITKPPKNPELLKDKSLKKSNKSLLKDSRVCPPILRKELTMTFD